VTVALQKLSKNLLTTFSVFNELVVLTIVLVFCANPLLVSNADWQFVVAKALAASDDELTGVSKEHVVVKPLSAADTSTTTTKTTSDELTGMLSELKADDDTLSASDSLERSWR